MEEKFGRVRVDKNSNKIITFVLKERHCDIFNPSYINEQKYLLFFSFFQTFFFITFVYDTKNKQKDHYFILTCFELLSTDDVKNKNNLIPLIVKEISVLF